MENGKFIEQCQLILFRLKYGCMAKKEKGNNKSEKSLL